MKLKNKLISFDHIKQHANVTLTQITSQILRTYDSNAVVMSELSNLTNCT